MSTTPVASSQSTQNQRVSNKEVLGCTVLALTCLGIALRFVPPMRFRAAVVASSLLPSAIWAGAMLSRKPASQGQPKTGATASSSKADEAAATEQPKPEPVALSPEAQAFEKHLEEAESHQLQNLLREVTPALFCELQGSELFSSILDETRFNYKQLLTNSTNVQQLDAVIRYALGKQLCDRELIREWVRCRSRAVITGKSQEQSVRDLGRELKSLPDEQRAWGYEGVTDHFDCLLDRDTIDVLFTHNAGDRVIREVQRGFCPSLEGLSLIIDRANSRQCHQLVILIGTKKLEVSDVQLGAVLKKTDRPFLQDLEVRKRAVILRLIPFSPTDIDRFQPAPDTLFDALFIADRHQERDKIWNAIEGWEGLQAALDKQPASALLTLYRKFSKSQILEAALRAREGEPEPLCLKGAATLFAIEHRWKSNLRHTVNQGMEEALANAPLSEPLRQRFEQYQKAKSYSLKGFLMRGEIRWNQEAYIEARQLGLHAVANRIAQAIEHERYIDWYSLVPTICDLKEHIRSDAVIEKLKKEKMNLVRSAKDRTAINSAKAEEAELSPTISTLFFEEENLVMGDHRISAPFVYALSPQLLEDLQNGNVEESVANAVYGWLKSGELPEDRALLEKLLAGNQRWQLPVNFSLQCAFEILKQDHSSFLQLFSHSAGWRKEDRDVMNKLFVANLDTLPKMDGYAEWIATNRDKVVARIAKPRRRR